MEPQVLHEDDSILVVDKPAGMVVNRATTVRGATLQDWVEENFQFPIFRDSRLRNGIVHRLDKETSGVVVIAKTAESFVRLQEQFARRTVSKVYLALVHGEVKPRMGSIALPLARSQRNRERFAVSAIGKKAKTSWRVLGVYKNLRRSGVNTRGYQGFSFLEIKPKTGRTHQIRVHMAHLKHPIVGDVRYTGRKRGREDRKWCSRQFLHAARLAFGHPQSGRRVRYEASLPEDLSAVLELLD
ncbi:RluA family pseudouridine synthase [Patescibacteria group bacterium]|nr:RluA family pseudouridine synthase [Patescibacteria group bacterium]